MNPKKKYHLKEFPADNLVDCCAIQFVTASRNAFVIEPFLYPNFLIAASLNLSSNSFSKLIFSTIGTYVLKEVYKGFGLKIIIL